VEAKNGKFIKLILMPGHNESECQRVLVLPADLFDEQLLNKSVVKAVTEQGGNKRIEVQIKGRTKIVGGL